MAKRRLLVGLWLLVTAVSLLGHFVVEGICVASEQSVTCLEGDSNPTSFTLSGLHAGFLAPKAPLTGLVFTLAFAFVNLSLTFCPYVPPPLFRPPVPLCQ